MTSFNSILRDIKSIKIQGATNIAKAAVDAIIISAKENKKLSEKELLHSLKEHKKEMMKARPTEPCMRNSLNFLFEGIDHEKNILQFLHKRSEEITDHFKKAEEKISLFTSRKIRNNDIIFTHCHSSSVTKSIITAKKQGKTFTVHNTETRPLYQGRITAKELAREDIPVVHYVDSAARLALKDADIMLLGADAVTSEGKVINKIGSELFAEVADKYNIPLYICTDSWKIDPESVFGYKEEIKKRLSAEVWPAAHEGIKISNLAFEKIDPSLIAGIISELGVYSPYTFIEEVRRTYHWLFSLL